MKPVYLLCASGLALISAACTQAYDAQPAAPIAKVESVTQSAPASAAGPESRRAFFGETHLHTGYSFDAYALMGSRAEPETAWRFARGEAVTYMGKTMRRPRPLDFMALTDHAEYLGASMRGLRSPETPFAQSKAGRLMLENPLGAALGQLVSALSEDKNSRERLDEVMADAWSHEVSLANRYNQPGTFTAFVAYEWTTMLDGKYNMHRNVIFRGGGPQRPFSATDSTRPEDLWAYLERQRAQGVEGLAIPHNSNASGGMMFDWNNSDGKPIDAAYARLRAMNEPLVETYQHKGASETSPLLSPEDNFANFERAEALLVGGRSKVQGSYARDGLGRGLVIESKVGANPFKFGFVAASDYHNGLADSRESAYAGAGLSSSDPETNMPDLEFARTILGQQINADGGPPAIDKIRDNMRRARSLSQGDLLRTPGLLNWSAAGLTGVWAEENTRASLYASMRRKETFATSGTQLRLRMFGGWDLPDKAMAQPGWVKSAYRTGVPMGGDLPAAGNGQNAPQFLFEAAKDPQGANLDRIQVIKLWLEGDRYREKIFDVAWSSERRIDPRTGKVPAVANTVDLKSATYSNSIGAAVLRAQWRDPEFDPARPAVYYARVLEIPTPRWPTLLAAHHGLPLPKGVPATLQERAISSPIWYNPQR